MFCGKHNLGMVANILKTLGKKIKVYAYATRRDKSGSFLPGIEMPVAKTDN